MLHLQSPEAQNCTLLPASFCCCPSGAGCCRGLGLAPPSSAASTSPLVTMPWGPVGVTSSAERPLTSSRCLAAGPILALRFTASAAPEEGFGAGPTA